MFLVEVGRFSLNWLCLQAAVTPPERRHHGFWLADKTKTFDAPRALTPFQQRKQVILGKRSKLNMPILARRIPDNFFYFCRRCKARSVGCYLKDIRRERMARLVCRRIGEAAYRNQFFR